MHHIQMRRIDGGVTQGRMKADVPAADSLRNARSRLLVLWAGHASATVHAPPEQCDFDDDFRDMTRVLLTFLGLKELNQVKPPSIEFDNPTANTLIQESLNRALGIVSNTSIANAITAVAKLLLDAPPDTDGLCVVPAAEIVEVCERVCGEHVRQDSEWSSWINGE